MCLADDALVVNYVYYVFSYLFSLFFIFCNVVSIFETSLYVCVCVRVCPGWEMIGKVAHFYCTLMHVCVCLFVCVY